MKPEPSYSIHSYRVIRILAIAFKCTVKCFREMRLNMSVCCEPVTGECETETRDPSSHGGDVDGRD